MSSPPLPPGAPRKGRPLLTLVLVILVFAGPALVAWLVLTKAWLPSGSVAHGNLVQPARPLSVSNLPALDGSMVSLEKLRGRWTFLLFDGSLCDQVCRDNLYKTRQIRLAVGEDTHRVQRVMVLTETEAAESFRQVLTDHQDLIVLAPEAPSLQALLSEFRMSEGEPVGTLRRVYIVDPIGNLMMYYDKGAEAKGILEDLERLLKASQIG